uniref:Uncharacterized protein n=1 Tax=Peronospora matthiolae TaxID=2874970 RepID=A0AAV1U5D4_9STRA
MAEAGEWISATWDGGNINYERLLFSYDLDCGSLVLQYLEFQWTIKSDRFQVVPTDFRTDSGRGHTSRLGLYKLIPSTK